MLLLHTPVSLLLFSAHPPSWFFCSIASLAANFPYPSYPIVYGIVSHHLPTHCSIMKIACLF